MKKLLLLLLALLPPCVHATTTVSGNWTVNTTIPDNDDTGYSNTRTFSATGINQIQTVTVGLSFNGGWNGDLYVYLVHNGTMSVLLNRPGRSLTDPDGASSSGMVITLTDLASGDVHTSLAFSGSPTGSYQPDGRTTDPYTVLDTDTRPALLALFNGQSADGSWKLFVADQAPGEQSQLVGWSLSVTGVPEPSAPLLFGTGVLSMTAFRRRRITSTARKDF